MSEEFGIFFSLFFPNNANEGEWIISERQIKGFIESLKKIW